jgi:hypothetical protein
LNSLLVILLPSRSEEIPSLRLKTYVLSIPIGFVLYELAVFPQTRQSTLLQVIAAEEKQIAKPADS